MTPPFAEAAGAPVKRRRVSAAPPPVVTIDYALHYAELKPRASKPPPPPLPRPPAASHNDFRALFSTVEREFAYTHVYRKFLTTMASVHNETISTHECLRTLTDLFKDSAACTAALNAFLPTAYKLPLPRDAATALQA